VFVFIFLVLGGYRRHLEAVRGYLTGCEVDFESLIQPWTANSSRRCEIIGNGSPAVAFQQHRTMAYGQGYGPSGGALVDNHFPSFSRHDNS
ncbi:hypothetical protein AKJ16_DCAP12238, partial [Drosera capensis]